MEQSAKYCEVYALSRLNYYKSLGIQLWVEGDKLKFRVEKQKMSQECMDQLKRDKELLLEHLKRLPQIEKDYFPITPIQAAYIAGEENGYELGNTNAHYYTEYIIENADLEKLQMAVNAVIKNNDALRLVIEKDGRQRVLKKVPEYVIEDRKKTTREIRDEWSHHFYKLGDWPMFHFELSHTDENVSVLHFSFDCLIMDAWSAKLMLAQVFSIYKGETTEFANYSFEEYMRQISVLETSEADQKAEKYWKEQMEHMPQAPKLHYLKEFAKVERLYYQRLQFEFTREDTEKLYQKLKPLYITPSALLCTIFMKLLSFYSEEKSLTLNLTLFNRKPMHTEMNKVLGDFTNVGFVSYFDKEGATFLEDLKAISKQFWKLVEFHSYDGTKVLKEFGRKSPGKAVMPVVFTSVLQGSTRKEDEAEFQEIFTISQTPQTAIDHQLRDDGEGLRLSWDYVVELFDEGEISRMFQVYIAFIKKMIHEDDWNKIFDIKRIEESI